MTFGREKRLWLGTLALLAPIPLPFNQVLEWPFLFLYALFLIYFLQRAEQGTWITLGNWALNILGLAYMPIFYLDLRAAFARGSAVTALLHLIMFLLVVKVYSIRREKDKWHIMVAIYFLFVGAMATSSHVSIVPYLGTFLVLSQLVLARFAHLHMMAGTDEDQFRAIRLPFRAPLTLGTLLILLVAVPLFATMPRVREPYILGRGTGGGGMARTTGFSDSVDLSLTTSIRSNRNVAMRVQYDDQVQMGDPASLRFKGATYDIYRNRQWFRTLRLAEVLIPTNTTAIDRLFRLGSEESAVNKATFFLEPINSFSVILPVEALSIKLDSEAGGMGIDPGGAVVMPARPRETLTYEVELAAKPVIHAKFEDDPESGLSALDPSGLTPRMIELAQQVMGEGTSEERIDRLEQHLLTQYDYTIDFLGRSGESPLEDFLFVYKSGHCEFFASAMVLMLRSQQIPARFVTGFLGAELNPLEDYFVIRQQNAHAWVEAYTESRGWRIYDPTPPDGRPTVEPQSLSLLLSQVYDYITFRWDRYVLTYGAEDQDSFFKKLRERWQGIWGRVKSLGKKDPAKPSAPFADDTAVRDEVPSPWVWQPDMPLILLLGLFVSTAALLIVWNRGRPLSGEVAYLLLRRRLERAGIAISDTLAPLELQDLAVERFPAAAAVIRQVIALYVHESFAGQTLADSERQGLRAALRSLDTTLRQQAKQERRERRRKGPGRPLPASV